ncbi:glycoside hydrolase family 88 protein [Schleiferilactobacillus harbinensis]|uniref:glycoside hydrolase family 88 protein n=1 Tax=Schleiferilactobacillus harbinensis TaxID=304207 RepID=UPI0039E7B480
MAEQQWQLDDAGAQRVLIQAYVKVDTELQRLGDKIPYIAEAGVYREDRGRDVTWWTNGFFAGMLWQLEQVQHNPAFIARARRDSDRLMTRFRQFTTIDHDIGFVALQTAVADFRATGQKKARQEALLMATVLAGRYNPAGQFLRCWNQPGRAGWVIIDSMMNLNLLFWAGRELQDPRFSQIAVAHADSVLANQMRADASAYHVVGYDPVSGNVADYPPGQGYSPQSAWTRGQGWALYGFVLAYQQTGFARYLTMARASADYFITQAERYQWIIPADFDAPDNGVLDMSAAMIAASGLVTLSIIDNDPGYRQAAERLLIRNRDRIDLDPTRDGIVQDCSGSYASQMDGEKNVPIIYADFFFIETLMKLAGYKYSLWALPTGV